MLLPVIKPNWTAPSQVVAFTTTIDGGVSQGNYCSLNLGDHVGDNPDDVSQNRIRLQQMVGDEVKLAWLSQTHSDMMVNLTNYIQVVEADAAVTTHKNQACLIMTADCLPVLLCNQAGTKVAGLHCGWKGLYQNLIAKMIAQYFVDETIIAWLGPAIGQLSYEVDEGLYQRFIAVNSQYQQAFLSNRKDHYLFDLYEIARQQLKSQGVAEQQIFGGGFDTFSDKRFFSYRQNPQTGRIATLIYRV